MKVRTDASMCASMSSGITSRSVTFGHLLPSGPFRCLSREHPVGFQLLPLGLAEAEERTEHLVVVFAHSRTGPVERERCGRQSSAQADQCPVLALPGNRGQKVAA